MPAARAEAEAAKKLMEEEMSDDLERKRRVTAAVARAREARRAREKAVPRERQELEAFRAKHLERKLSGGNRRRTLSGGSRGAVRGAAAHDGTPPWPGPRHAGTPLDTPPPARLGAPHDGTPPMASLGDPAKPVPLADV
jgi:hypothetical protein